MTSGHSERRREKPSEEVAPQADRASSAREPVPSSDELSLRGWLAGRRVTELLECEQRFEHGR